jgi:hypothetical protein
MAGGAAKALLDAAMAFNVVKIFKECLAMEVNFINKSDETLTLAWCMMR